MAIDQSSRINRRAVAIVVALLVAVASVVGLFFLVQSQTKSNGTGNYVGVWVTKDQLVAGATIASNDVQVLQRDPATLPSNYLDSGRSPIGQNILVATAPGTVLTQTTIAPTASSALSIPDGWVAMALPNSTTAGVGGYIQAGDHIDVLADATLTESGTGTATASHVIKYIVQDVRVLKTGSAAGGSSGASVIVVAVPRAQAEELAFFQYLPPPSSNQAYLFYVLRNANQSSKVDPHTGLAQAPIYLSSGPASPNLVQSETLTLNVIGEGQTATKALSNAQSAQQSLHDALVSAGIPSISITDNPAKFNNYATASSVSGTATAEATVVVAIPDATTLAEVIDVARKAGVTQSYSPPTATDQPITSSQMACLFAGC